MEAGTERTAESYSEIKSEGREPETGRTTLAAANITNPGTGLDTLGVTCELLYERMHRVGDAEGKEAMWNALQEFNVTYHKIDSQYGGTSFGEEM